MSARCADGPHVTIDARMLHVSGIGTYLQELLPRVIGRWTEARFTVLGNVERLRAVLPPSPRVALRELTAPIYSLREQVVLARTTPSATTLFWAPHYNIPLLHRGRLAVTVHDVNHLALPQASRLRRTYARVLFRAVRRRARVVLCDSHFTATELTARAGVPREVVVAHLGVAERWFACSDARAPVREPYFLFVGNVKPHKNLGRLLAAFAALPPELPHRLVIVGQREGLLTSDHVVTRLAARMGGRVQFTGYLSRESLEQHVASCDALLLPSLYEGFGLPPLEAMACGRAVAVARAGSLPEVCGPEADYFDPVDVEDIAAVLMRVATRPPDTDDIRARRRAWARRYDWERCADVTVDALRRAESDAR